jgi:hypothetical protein
MNVLESIKAFLDVPELFLVGSPQERAAFIAIRLEGRTVREAAKAIGVSKSHVPNLADMFQEKLMTRLAELSKGRSVSVEYRKLHQQLYRVLRKLADESGSEDYVDGAKIGKYDPQAASQEDWAEVRGTPLIDPDR